MWQEGLTRKAHFCSYPAFPASSLLQPSSAITPSPSSSPFIQIASNFPRAATLNTGNYPELDNISFEGSHVLKIPVKQEGFYPISYPKQQDWWLRSACTYMLLWIHQEPFCSPPSTLRILGVCVPLYRQVAKLHFTDAGILSNMPQAPSKKVAT